MGLWKIIPLLFCIVCVSSKVASKVASKVESKVEKLDDTNFDSFLKKSELVLVKFYTTWCHFSQELAPIYDDAADKGVEGAIFAQVECEIDGKTTCKEQKIEGYPTLAVFRKGKKTGFYDGKRTSDALVDFMKKQHENKELLHDDINTPLDFKHMCLLKDKAKWIQWNKE